MNLDKSDYQALEVSMEAIKKQVNSTWIDPDYSMELEYRSKIVLVLDDTLRYIRRYYKNNP